MMESSIIARRQLVEVAKSYVGVMEIGADNQGAEVQEFQKAVDGLAQGEPWCACFVQYCLAQVATRFRLQSRLFRSENVLEIWRKTPTTNRRASPYAGTIAIWGVIGKSGGHCGIVTDWEKGSPIFQTIEGNTGPGKDVEREGDGVYEKNRFLSAKTNRNLGQLRLEGFLDPYF